MHRKVVENGLGIIVITLSLDEARALLNQSSNTWLVRRFRQLLKLYA